MPKLWKAKRFGGSEVMEWVDTGPLEPGEKELRIKIHASGINFAETRMVAGTYRGMPLPIKVGMESAGVVEAVGPGVTRFKVGDRVMGRAAGSHGEATLMEEQLTMPLPANLSFEEGAAIPVGWHTAWHALHTVARIRPGQKVLIEAAASSVGSAATQIAKQAGCWVGVTASRDDKLQHALKFGADALYNYKQGPFNEQVLADTGGKGVDVACMTIGEETAERLIASMGDDGKVVMYGSTGGRIVSFDLSIGTRNLSLLSMSLATAQSYFDETIQDFHDRALPLFESGVFTPMIDTVLPMRDVAKAHQMVHDRRHFGKVILSNDVA